MSDEALARLLQSAAARVPESAPPVVDLLRAGRRVRRRRARTALAGVCAAVLVAAGATVVGVHDGRHEAALPAVLPAPPAGTKWVGIGHTVVAVPKGWPVWPGVYCDDGPNTPYVTIVDHDAAVACPAQQPPRGAVESVDMSAGPGGGLEVGVGGEGTRVTVASLTASETRLPDGWLAIPAADPRGGVGAPDAAGETAAVRAAGFRVVTDRVPAWGTRSRITTDPEIGAPARVGSTVTIHVPSPELATSGLRGRLLWVGGPAPLLRPHGGTVHVTGHGFDEYVGTDRDGNWHLALPPGRYLVRATSPGYLSGPGAPDACRADSPVTTVRRDATTTADVYCQLR